VRSVRHEILSASVVLAIPAALLLAFPYPALGFRASVERTVSPTVSYVRLSDVAEKAALAVAKTSWQADASAARRNRRRLRLGELPEEDRNTPLGLAIRQEVTASVPSIDYEPSAWRPSVAAASPERLESPVCTPSPPAFSREELLEVK